jgi:hypothetical protein
MTMLIFPTAVFSLIFITCIVCLALLVIAYRRTGARLLLWSALCFVFLAVNSVLIVLDMVVLHEVDLQLYRHIATLAAVSVLLYGFIWDVD